MILDLIESWTEDWVMYNHTKYQILQVIGDRIIVIPVPKALCIVVHDQPVDRTGLQVVGERADTRHHLEKRNADGEHINSFRVW